MSLLQKVKTSLREDPLFQRVIKNSLHLFSSNTISVGLSFVQGIFATRLLGPEGFGLIGIVMGFASTVNSILSFRMSEIVVRYGGEYLEKGEKQKASALVKTAGMAEMAVSVLAFLIVAGVAGWASRTLSDPPAAAWMFTVFALGLLANFNYETSIGVLQITNKIKLQGTINLIQSILTTLIIIAASIWSGSIETVLFAYLLSKTILGLGMFFVAQAQLHHTLGGGWWKEPFSTLPNPRELVRFAVSSNVSATIIKIFRESEILWVGFFLSNEAAGYYRVAYTLVSFLHIPADPLISTTFPEINRLAAQRSWARLKDFLRKITTLSFVYNLALAFGLVLFGHWVIGIYSGWEYLPAYPAMLALLVGLSFNYTLFWNRPLLLSLGLPTFPVRATLIVGLIKLILAFIFVPRYGILAAGAVLSFYYIASVGAMAWRGVKEINAQAGAEPRQERVI